MRNIKILVVFDGQEDGIIEHMSRRIAEGARKAGAEVLMLTASAAKPEDALLYDALIIGTPCHFAGPSAAIKRYMDSTWAIKGKLAGKIGAAFTASEHLAGGHEITLLSTIAFFLTHGMIIEGNVNGDPLGEVVIAPDGDRKEALTDDPEGCKRLGAQVAKLAGRLKK